MLYRLTHSYLRREIASGKGLGGREDWRFAQMRESMGPAAWAVGSFFYAYVSQHPLLFGITLPFYVIHLYTPLSAIPFGIADVVILGTALFGLLFAYRAGTYTHAYEYTYVQPAV